MNGSTARRLAAAAVGPFLVLVALATALALPDMPDGEPAVAATAAPTVRPMPGSYAIGFDYDGGEPTIHPDPGEFDYGGSATVSLVFLGQPNLIQHISATIEYDATVADLIGCLSHPQGTCVVDANTGEITVAVSAVGGLPGAAVLAQLTFRDKKSDYPCATLLPNVVEVLDIGGDAVSGLVMPFGMVCFLNGYPTPPPDPPPNPLASMEAMSIDMDVSGNTATGLGARDGCVEAAPGDLVTFDVTAEGIPADYPMIAFHAVVGFPANVVLQSYDLNYLLAASPGSQILDPTIGGSYPAELSPFEAVDISDHFSIPPEFGSGVLNRITVAIQSDAAPGAYPLTLAEPVHIDPLNSALLANVANGATLVVGGDCANPPPTPPHSPSPILTPTPTPTATPAPPPLTPTPTVTPPPPPGAAPIGFDHDGGPPDINDGPKTAASGTVKVPIVAVAPPQGLGAWEYRVHFDSTRFEAVDCSTLAGVCNLDYLPYAVAFAGVNISGVYGATILGDITLALTGTTGGCTDLLMAPLTLADPLGEPVFPLVYNGQACIDDAGPPDGSGATPSPAPTPPPPYPTFPPPTPGGTAGPTPPPGGGPPVFDPGGSLCADDITTPDSCDGENAPGEATDLTFMMCAGWSDDCSGVPDVSQLESTAATLVNFIPPEYGVDGSSAPVGAISGRVIQNLVFGILNGPCSTAISTEFTLLNASLNQADPIQSGPVGPEEMAPLAEDASPQNGIPDGADRYPAYLSELLQDIQPRERLFGATNIYGAWITYNVLIFEPGSRVVFPGVDIAPPQDMGYPVLLVFDDPARADGPGAITDVCAPMRIAFQKFGTTYNNPCTQPFDGEANCPGLPSSIQNVGYPLLPCSSGNTVDEDGDGWVNDGCARVNAVAETGDQCGNNTSDDPTPATPEDTAVNDGCPAVGDPEGTRDGPCTRADEGGCVVVTNPPDEGTYLFRTMALSHRDADSDGIDNTLDVCATVYNSDWDPGVEDSAQDADLDGLPNACDPNPGAPSPMTPASCPTGLLGPDEDQDCAPNRGDDCPTVNQLGDPSSDPGADNPVIMLDTDGDAIGDVCDPSPDYPDGVLRGYCLNFALDVGGDPAAPVVGSVVGGGPECLHPLVCVCPASFTPPAAEVSTQDIPVQSSTPTPSPTALAAAALPNAGGSEGSTQPWPGLAALALATVSAASVVFFLWTRTPRWSSRR